MKPVCVLGNGQLGRMLRQAGEPLGIAVYPVGLDAEPEAVPYQQAVITAEIERWPDTPLTEILARHPGFVNRDVFPRLADRLTQKRLLDTLKLATAPLAIAGKRRTVAGSLSFFGGSLPSSNAASAATTAAGSGGLERVMSTRCPRMPTAPPLSNRRLRFAAKPR
ncbi:N5-carboxyaminoimidazole ribonucleotide synthase [Leminorella grimontii]|nr:N5-carboxyaminoimidazole ribonucleotide synthase [Leminorella grimontii]